MWLLSWYIKYSHRSCHLSMSSYSTASCYDVNAACNGEYVKSGLAELEQWCYDATEEYGGSAWDDLKHIRQAVGFLVIHQKPKKTLNEITKDLCPALIIQQLYRINTMYWDDKYGTHTVSADKIETPKKRWKLAPTKREQQKWDRAAKAATEGTLSPSLFRDNFTPETADFILLSD